MKVRSLSFTRCRATQIAPLETRTRSVNQEVDTPNLITLSISRLQFSFYKAQRYFLIISRILTFIRLFLWLARKVLLKLNLFQNVGIIQVWTLVLGVIEALRLTQKMILEHDIISSYGLYNNTSLTLIICLFQFYKFLPWSNIQF